MALLELHLPIKTINFSSLPLSPFSSTFLFLFTPLFDSKIFACESQYRFIYEKQDSDGEKSDQELVVDVANDTDSAPLNGKGGSPRENGNGLESNGNSSNSLSEKGIKKEPGMFDGSFLNINLNIN